MALLQENRSLARKAALLLPRLEDLGGTDSSLSEDLSLAQALLSCCGALDYLEGAPLLSRGRMKRIRDDLANAGTRLYDKLHDKHGVNLANTPGSANARFAGSLGLAALLTGRGRGHGSSQKSHLFFP